MKTIFFLSLLAFGLIVSAFSQKETIELSFTAQHDGQHIPLDSILIENLTQGGDTTIFAPDTVLLLDYITNIGSNEIIGGNTFSVSQNYPNPFNGKTEVNLYLPVKEDIKISVRDILGRELAQYENSLNRGNHSFIFYSGNEQFYLLTVTGKQTSKTIKMLNSVDNPSHGKCKIVYSDYNNNTNGLKSQRLRRVASALAEKAINDFVYAPGDELRYIGYANTVYGILGSDVMEDAPSVDTTYQFDISEGVPCPGTPTFTYGGQVYKTLQIGEQCWMKENLNVGIMIPGDEEMTDNGVIEKYCYNNDTEYCDEYGALYSWNEAMIYSTSTGAQGICPDGWHIPTDGDCNDLTYTLGGTNLAGGLMKEIGTEHWEWPNTAASNQSGFTARAAGYTDVDAGFNNLKLYLYFWNSEEFEPNPESAWYRSLAFIDEFIMRANLDKKWGFSARCIRD